MNDTSIGAASDDAIPPEGTAIPPEGEDLLADEEALDRELASVDAVLTTQLRELLDPDAGLGVRTAIDVGRALSGRSTVAAAIDLLGTGWWTARSLLTEDTSAADQEPEGI